MEEDGDGGQDLTPFWLQTNTNLPRAHQLRRRASSVFLSSGLVVFLLLVTAVIFLVFVVPSTLSLSSQIFRPNSVKRSWDSLNVLLVLVAVVFGFLNRNKDEDWYSSSYYGENQESLSSEQNKTRKSNPSTPQHWYNFNTIEGEKSNLSSSDRWYDYPDFESNVEYTNPILRRNSSSHPDLREFPSTRWAREDFQRRFDEDMNVGMGRALDPGQLHRRHRSLEEVDYLRVPSRTKTVFVDTLVNKSMPAEGFPHSSLTPPYQPVLPTSPPLGLQEKPNRAKETVARKKERSRRKMEKDMETLYTVSTERTPPPHPPPPQENSSKSDRKRGGSGGSSSATKDDMNVGTGRALDQGQLHRRHRSLEEVDYLRVPSRTKTVFVDTLVNKSMPAESFPHSSSMPPYQPVLPTSPSLGLQEKPNRAQETVARKKERSRRKMEKDMETLYTVSTERTPPPPPPPPQQNSSESDRKRGGSGGSSSATKDFLNSFYHKKKKKQRQKSVDNLDLLLHQTEAPLSFQLPPSSPPSPPPPSVFQNLFSSKKPKRKRTITVTVKSPSPAPSPTPPEHPTPQNAEPEQNANSRKAPFPIHKPENFEKLAEISNSGGESPLNRVPPPPPPPPFLKKPAWKFTVQGDYVRLDSVNSSRSGSPDLDELDSDIASDTGNATAPSHPSPLSCPSPDVNTKAESFITNFRAKLKLERHQSMKKSKELGLSSLGPVPSPSQ